MLSDPNNTYWSSLSINYINIKINWLKINLTQLTGLVASLVGAKPHHVLWEIWSVSKLPHKTISSLVNVYI